VASGLQAVEILLKRGPERCAIWSKRQCQELIGRDAAISRVLSSHCRPMITATTSITSPSSVESAPLFDWSFSVLLVSSVLYLLDDVAIQRFLNPQGVSSRSAASAAPMLLVRRKPDDITRKLDLTAKVQARGSGGIRGCSTPVATLIACQYRSSTEPF